MDKYIRVKNCNCISDATIEIVEKSLNIKYGSNGTGKSTISEAIYAQANNETDRLKDFKPYGSNDNSQPRDFAFWEEELCKSILSKFMPRDKYFEYDEIQKLVKKYDSQARLTSYKMSMIKDFLGDEFSEKVDESFQYSLEDLQKINTQVDLVKSRIERIEKDLSSNEKEKTQNRIESERVNKKMLDIEKLW